MGTPRLAWLGQLMPVMATLAIRGAKSSGLEDKLRLARLGTNDKSGSDVMEFDERSTVVSSCTSAKTRGTAPTRLLPGRITETTRLLVMVTPNHPEVIGVVAQFAWLTHPPPFVARKRATSAMESRCNEDTRNIFLWLNNVRPVTIPLVAA